MHVGVRGAGDRNQRKTAPHLGHQGPADVLCSVAVRAGAGGWWWPGEGAGAVGAELSSPRRKRLLSEEAGGAVTAPPRRTPARCPLLPPSPVFLGLPLGFLPGVVVVFRVLAAPLFLLPFGLPRGLLGVGTSLGSFGGCFLGLPRPRFSVPSFSCLEARGWLDFELDSLIFPSLRSRWRSDG